MLFIVFGVYVIFVTVFVKISAETINQLLSDQSAYIALFDSLKTLFEYSITWVKHLKF